MRSHPVSPAYRLLVLSALLASCGDCSCGKKPGQPGKDVPEMGVAAYEGSHEHTRL